jgi:16S rRNA C967 or C1407 C5-methylase (RsmB/RsmF family)
MVILNHNAQNFPYLYYKDAPEAVLFDRIVCDVPCSSDAAIRKIPSKWEKWATQDGAALHVLQTRILFKGL